MVTLKDVGELAGVTATTGASAALRRQGLRQARNHAARA